MAQLHRENVASPLNQKRLDLYVIRHPYDIVNGKIKDLTAFEKTAITLEENSEERNLYYSTHQFCENPVARNMMNQYRYNEHDWKHRKACFKKNKGEECRAVLPTLQRVGEKWVVWGDADADGDNNAVSCFSPPLKLRDSNLDNAIWHETETELGEDSRLFYCKQRRLCPFTVMPERTFGDQFMNVFNQVISDIIACNNNVQIGDIGHVFYNTLYNTKNTQSDDSQNFLFISNGFARVFHAQIERREREGAASAEDAPDFVEGLIRVMAGIRAHMASTIVSAPMAHLLATRKSRFHISCETKGLVLSQITALMEGREINYYYRRSTKKASESGDVEESENNGGDNKNGDDKHIWPDCTADSYMLRPKDLHVGGTLDILV